MIQTDASAPTDFRALFVGAPAPMLVLAPDAPRFTITDVNDAYLAAVMRTRDDLVGRGVFEAMPDNPDDPHATGVANLRASIERAILARRPDRMPVQKYDIPRPGGDFEERWWDPVNAPVLDGCGEVVAVVHHVVDATERMRTEAELRSHAVRQSFRLALEERLRALTDPVAMMEAATALLGEHLRAAQVGFAEVENDQAHIVVARDWNDGRIASIAGRWRMDDFGPAFIREMKAGETIAIPDILLDARTRAPEVVAAYNGINTRAILDVPLVKHGRMVAVLFVHNPEPRAWASDEQALVEETCERLWSNARRRVRGRGGQPRARGRRRHPARGHAGQADRRGAAGTGRGTGHEDLPAGRRDRANSPVPRGVPPGGRGEALGHLDGAGPGCRWACIAADRVEPRRHAPGDG
jgi:PAS domain-containing protein